MNAQNIKFFALALCLAVCVVTCRADDTAAPTVNADSTAQAAAPGADAAAPGPNAGAEKSESFAQWAYDKISSGFGMKSEEEKPVAQTEKIQTEAGAENSAAPSSMAPAASLVEEMEGKAAESFDKIKEAATGKTNSK